MKRYELAVIKIAFKLTFLYVKPGRLHELYRDAFARGQNRRGARGLGDQFIQVEIARLWVALPGLGAPG